MKDPKALITEVAAAAREAEQKTNIEHQQRFYAAIAAAVEYTLERELADRAECPDGGPATGCAECVAQGAAEEPTNPAIEVPAPAASSSSNEETPGAPAKS